MVVATSSAAQLRPLQTSWNSLRASTQFMPIFSSMCFRVKAPLSRLVPTLSFVKQEEYSFRRMRFCVRAGIDLNKLKREGGIEEDKKLQDVLVDKQQIQALDNMGSSASGELHLIVGPMFAGKTTALIHRMQTEIQIGRNVVLVKSNKDTRYGLSSVVSHDGAKMPCWAAADLASFKAKLGEEAYRKEKHKWRSIFPWRKIGLIQYSYFDEDHNQGGENFRLQEDQLMFGISASLALMSKGE